jgi:hypothetical protein
MTRVPAGTELIRAFVSTKDFDLSKRFYEVLGFEKVFDGEVAIFNVGSGGIILQRYYQEQWAQNTMLQLLVDDLDAWWEHVSALDLAAQFGVQSPQPPAVQPWSLRVTWGAKDRAADVSIPVCCVPNRVRMESHADLRHGRLPKPKRSGIPCSHYFSSLTDEAARTAN